MYIKNGWTDKRIELAVLPGAKNVNVTEPTYCQRVHMFPVIGKTWICPGLLQDRVFTRIDNISSVQPFIIYDYHTGSNQTQNMQAFPRTSK